MNRSHISGSEKDWGIVSGEEHYDINVVESNDADDIYQLI